MLFQVKYYRIKEYLLICDCLWWPKSAEYKVSLCFIYFIPYCNILDLGMNENQNR